MSSGEHGLLGVLIVMREQKDLKVNSKGSAGLNPGKQVVLWQNLSGPFKGDTLQF